MDHNQRPGLLSEEAPVRTLPGNLLIECEAPPYFPELPESLLPTPKNLTEAAMQEAAGTAADGCKWRVAIIESCISDNNNWYRDEVLDSCKRVFEGAPCRIYSYDGRNGSSFHHDHMPGWLAARDAGSVTGNTVGMFDNVGFGKIQSQRNPGMIVNAVLADLTFCDVPTRNRILEAKRLGLMNPNGRSLFELSIEASGPHQNVLHESTRRQVKMVESIDHCNEVTIVSRGAAGGRFLEPVTQIAESTPDGTDTGKNSSQNLLLEVQAQKPNSSKPQPNECSLTEGPLKRLGSPSAVYARPAPSDALPSNGNGFATEDALAEENTAPTDTPATNEMIPQFGDNDYSQIQKAAEVLRSGNASLSLEIMAEILNKKETERNEEPVVGAQIIQPKQTSLNESKAMKEPIRMNGTIGVESVEGQGSHQQVLAGQAAGYQGQGHYNPNGQTQHQMLQESHRQFSDNDIMDFVRTVAQRDAAAEGTMNELRESVMYLASVNEAQSKQIAQQAQAQQLRECASILQARLRESGLPRETQTMIAKQYSGKRFAEAALLETIDAQKNYLVRMHESFAREHGIQNQFSGNAFIGNGTGHNRFSMGRNSIDVMQAELDRAFGYVPSKDATLTEAQRDVYKSCSETPSIKRPMGIWHGDMEYRMDGRLGPNPLLREAASTDVGLYALLQNSMTKSVMQRFMLLPASYREIAEIVPAQNFLEHQVIVTGGLGILPQVNESKTGVSYLTLGFPSNFQNKFMVGTYGGLIPVTRQAIINDNLQEIQEYPKRAAESAMMTLNLNVFGTLIGYFGYDASGAPVSGTINQAVSYDKMPIYHADHFNKTVNEMAYQELIDMQDRLFEQRTFGNTSTLAADVSLGDPSFTVTSGVNDFAVGIKKGDVIQIHDERVVVQSVSGNTITTQSAFQKAHLSNSNTTIVWQLSTPIAFDKRMLIVPTKLASRAYQLLASTLEPGVNSNTASSLNPAYVEGSLRLLQLHSMFLQNSIKNYYMTAGKPIRWAFLGGKETPEIMLQDNPLVGNVFSGDLISWKVRHEHGGTLMSHLCVQAGIVP